MNCIDHSCHCELGEECHGSQKCPTPRRTSLPLRLFCRLRFEDWIETHFGNTYLSLCFVEPPVPEQNKAVFKTGIAAPWHFAFRSQKSQGLKLIFGLVPKLEPQRESTCFVAKMQKEGSTCIGTLLTSKSKTASIRHFNCVPERYSTSQGKNRVRASAFLLPKSFGSPPIRPS